MPDFCGPSLNMWTVSCAELTASSVETRLKLIEYILASRVPRRNWYSFSAPGMLHTRMTVPFSEAVASIVPVELIERKEIGDLCAWMTFAVASERVEKSRTSPVCAAAVEGGCPELACVMDVGDGTGDE